MMASPQLEDGYTPIANELLEALYRVGLTGGEWDLMMCVARASYGWSQREAPISIGEVARRLGKHYSHTKRTARALMARGILARNRTGILIAKDYEAWGPRAVPGTVGGPGDHGRAQGGTTEEPIGGTKLVPPSLSNSTSPKGSRTRKTISKAITKANRSRTPSGRRRGVVSNGSEHQGIVTLFHRLYAEKVGTSPTTGAREGAIVKELLAKRRDPGEIRQALQDFFAYTPRRCREASDFTLRAFRGCFDQLVAARRRGEYGA